MSSDVVATPQLDKPYNMHTDACDYAAGGILVQDDSNGTEMSMCYIAWWSHGSLPASIETNYHYSRHVATN